MSEIERELQRIVPDEDRELRQAIGQIIKVVDRTATHLRTGCVRWLRAFMDCSLIGSPDRIYMMIGDELCATGVIRPKDPKRTR